MSNFLMKLSLITGRTDLIYSHLNIDQQTCLSFRLPQLMCELMNV